MDCKVILLSLVVLFGVSVLSEASLEDFVGMNSIGERREYLDNNEVYLVEWEAYTDTQTIVFELTVATTGYVGFGISPVGGMTGADIIFGGVHPNGSVYFSNRYGVGNRMPELDDNETWELFEASENTTHTYLKVGRQLNTCDSQDVSIGNGTNNFIWAFGQDDVIAYHGSSRGGSAELILDPPMPPIDTSNFQGWQMTHRMEMPTKETTYWCTVQKSPPLSTKHHIVGFRPILDRPEVMRHTHHFIVHKCRAPAGSTDEDTFERFVGEPGAECYVGSRDVPMDYCESYLFIWAVGGKATIYPDHVGYPLAVDGKSSYYLLEVHFDNPDNLQGVTIESGLEIFYTSVLRPNDAGTITAGHATSWAITVPPKSEDYVTVGHCAPVCSSYIPETGINVFNVLLHSHLAGRKLKLRHFRDGKELPWISSDDQYSFDYQQNRPLLEEIKILPGDQLTYECTYNSMNANGTIIGGLSTTDEMCNTFILYYPEIDLDVCSSEFPMSELRREFGIERTQGYFDPMVLAPESMVNKTYSEVLNTMIPWTREERDHLQQIARYEDHNVICSLAGVYVPVTTQPTIKYPDISMEYEPIDECASRDQPSSPPSSANKQAVIQYSLYLMACISVMIHSIQWI